MTMRHYMDVVSRMAETGEVIQFQPADVEARYVRDPNASPTAWRVGTGHADDPRAAMAGMKTMLHHRPNANQGLDGIRYVEFVASSDRAKAWLQRTGKEEAPRLYGKLAVIDFIQQLRDAGLRVRKKLV